MRQFLHTNALMHAGQKEAARSAKFALVPAFTVCRVRMTSASSGNNPIYRAQVERAFHGVADVGVPPEVDASAYSSDSRGVVGSMSQMGHFLPMRGATNAAPW